MTKKVDFSVCEFINENMWFFTYNDFCENRFAIKKLFNELDRNGKIFYMYYVYANVRINEQLKNAIWDYLNEFDEKGFELLRLWRINKYK